MKRPILPDAPLLLLLLLPAARLPPEHLHAPPDPSPRTPGPRHPAFPAQIEKIHLGPIPRISVISSTSLPTHRLRICRLRTLSVGNRLHECPETRLPPHRTPPRGERLRLLSQAIGPTKSRRLILGWVQAGVAEHPDIGCTHRALNPCLAVSNLQLVFKIVERRCANS